MRLSLHVKIPKLEWQFSATTFSNIVLQSSGFLAAEEVKMWMVYDRETREATGAHRKKHEQCTTLTRLSWINDLFELNKLDFELRFLSLRSLNELRIPRTSVENERRAFCLLLGSFRWRHCEHGWEKNEKKVEIDPKANTKSIEQSSRTYSRRHNQLNVVCVLDMHVKIALSRSHNKLKASKPCLISCTINFW